MAYRDCLSRTLLVTPVRGVPARDVLLSPLCFESNGMGASRQVSPWALEPARGLRRFDSDDLMAKY